MKSRRLLFMFMIAVLILSMVITGSATYTPPGPDNQPYFHIEPDPKKVCAIGAANLTCTSFYLDVKIYNVSAARPIAGYEFQLWYNSSFINATDCVQWNKTDTPPGVNPDCSVFPQPLHPINNTVKPEVGRVWVIAAFPVWYTWSGLDAIAFRITFHILADPIPFKPLLPPAPLRIYNSTLKLNGTALGDGAGLPIPHGTDDGLFSYTRLQGRPPWWVDFAYTPKYPYVGDTVTCTSTGEPMGGSVTAYLWDLEGPATPITAMDKKVMKFYCDGPGTVTVTLTAWDEFGHVAPNKTKQIEQIAPPVGGKATPIVMPVNKLELLAPYIGLTILLAVAVVTIVYVKKRKRNTEIIS